MDDKKIRVSIFAAGQRFNILTDKSEKYVLDIASKIESKINSLMITGDMSREKAAVLTALDYADDNETEKENFAAVKEQIKDYIHQIELLQDNNAKLSSDYAMLKEEYERLIAEKQTAEDAQKELYESKAEVKKLTAEAAELKKQIEELKTQSAPEEEEIPLPEEPPVKEEKTITADDDLFFDEPEEAPVKPQKDKKKRHEHNHVNPYQKKAQQKEQKGYTQQRQYSFFDIDEQ